MAVNLRPPGPLLPVPGVRLGVADADVKGTGRSRKDVLLVALDPGTTVTGVFTTNAFSAAPVQICRQRLADGGAISALIVNSGNANAGTGRAGFEAARKCLEAVEARLGGVALPFSTGVIGVPLPAARIVSAVPRAAADLRPDGWLDAARAIMTTDTLPKGSSRQVDIEGRTVTMTGIAKGAGMIRPDMATLLAFVATDAPLSCTSLQKALERAVADSFNAITVDGDTSTNDSLMLMATGAAGGPALAEDQPGYARFVAVLSELCSELAQAVVRDGEGATRFITITVDGARSREEARDVAYTLAHSPLFKTAAFAGDANWGRILAAVGRAPVPGLDLSRVDIAVGALALVRGGEPHPEYTEEAGAAVFARPELTVRIGLGRGASSATVYTCDLSHDYVRINAEYRT